MIINCTPHPIHVCGREIPPSGVVPRCAEIIDDVEAIDGIPVVRMRYGEVSGRGDCAGAGGRCRSDVDQRRHACSMRGFRYPGPEFSSGPMGAAT